MRFKKIFVNWGREVIIASYLKDYTVKDWTSVIAGLIADILLSHGYALSLKAKTEVESDE